jgi:hypothetical protein
MTMNRALAVIVGFYVLGCSSAIASPITLSVAELLENPEAYLNKEIVVKGFANIRFEDVNIYDADQSNQCLSLLVPTKEFEKYKAKFDGKRTAIRGTITSPACPEGSICTWICNQKYGLKVRDIAF